MGTQSLERRNGAVIFHALIVFPRMGSSESIVQEGMQATSEEFVHLTHEGLDLVAVSQVNNFASKRAFVGV
ncbi:hypothetical protein KCU62_g232, partial [Aureobasidium sp. EXF-3399]